MLVGARPWSIQLINDALYIRLRCACSNTVDCNHECNVVGLGTVDTQSIFTMQRANLLHTLVLGVITLQLQSANGSPLTLSDNPVQEQALLSANALVDEAKTFVKVCGYRNFYIRVHDFSSSNICVGDSLTMRFVC